MAKVIVMLYSLLRLWEEKTWTRYFVVMVSLTYSNQLDKSDEGLITSCQNFPINQNEDSNCDLYKIQIKLGTPVAEEGMQPFMVSLQDYQYEVPFHFCGGIIIDHNWVLTTAFCINSYDKSDIKIVAGETDLTKVVMKDVVVNVEKIILHESFSLFPKIRNNDIALVRVNPAFNFTSTVQKIQLSQRNFADLTGKTCQTYGWGMVSKFMLMSPVLKMANLTIISREDCESVYTWFPYLRQCICAVTEPLQGPCMGDWGGPLICENNEVIGLASWSNGCGDVNYPIVFLDLRKYNHWIKRTIKYHDKH